MEFQAYYRKKGGESTPPVLHSKVVDDIAYLQSYHDSSGQRHRFLISGIRLTDESGNKIFQEDSNSPIVRPGRFTVVQRPADADTDFQTQISDDKKCAFLSDTSSTEKAVIDFKGHYSGKITFEGDFRLEGPGAPESMVKFFDAYDSRGNNIFKITVGNTYAQGYEIRPVYSTLEGSRVTSCLKVGGEFLRYRTWYTVRVEIDTIADTLKFFINNIQIGADVCYPYLDADECFVIMQPCINGGYVLIKDKIYPITQGAVYIIPESEVHSINPSDTEQFIRSKLTVSKSFVYHMIEMLEIQTVWDTLFRYRKNVYRVFAYRTTLEIDELFRKISFVAEDTDFTGRALIQAYLAELFVLLFKSEFQSAYNYPKHISHIMKFINEHLFENFSIDQLCRSIPISKSYACSSFKTVTNMTITQDIIQRRLAEAKRMILTGEQSISEIAMATGFSSFSFFCQTFRKYEACTPLAFRKMYRGQ